MQAYTFGQNSWRLLSQLQCRTTDAEEMYMYLGFFYIKSCTFSITHFGKILCSRWNHLCVGLFILQSAHPLVFTINQWNNRKKTIQRNYNCQILKTYYTQQRYKQKQNLVLVCNFVLNRKNNIQLPLKNLQQMRRKKDQLKDWVLWKKCNYSYLTL